MFKNRFSKKTAPDAPIAEDDPSASPDDATVEKIEVQPTAFGTAESTFKADRRAAQRTPGVMVYNSQPYAVGLLWFTVQEENSKGLLQKRIKKTRADFTCQRQHIAMQQGFGWLSKGHRRGMPAAAAMIADQLVGEWHGVFEADNGWWYVQVRSDTITPNGDRFFTSEEEAYTLFQTELSQNIWPHAYAPDKWAFAGGNIRELSLKNILDDLTTTTLSPTNMTAMFGGRATRNTVLGGIAGAVVTMGALALYALFAPTDTPMPTAPPLRQVQRAVPLAKTGVADAVSPQQLLAQCGHAAGDLYASIPGWLPLNFTCGVGRSDMSWKQTTGLLNDARALGMQKWPVSTTVNFANRVMHAVLPLGNLPKVESQALPTQEMVLIALEQNFQPLGALQVKPVAAKPAAPATPPRAATVPLPPVAVKLPSYMDIQLISGFGPQKISPLLTGPGLQLLEVQWRIPQAMWQYKIKWSYENPVKAATPVKPAVAPAAAVGQQP